MTRWDDEGRGRWYGRGRDRDDEEREAQRVRGRPMDDVWVGRRGFDEGRSASNERYGYGSNDQRTGGERLQQRLGMSNRGYDERFDTPQWQGDRDAEGGYPYAGEARRSFWGRGEDEGGAWTRDRDDEQWGYGSQDRVDRSRWEHGRFVDRRSFGHVDDSRIRMSGGPRGSGLDSGRFAGNEEQGFGEPPYRPGGFGHGRHGRGGFIDEVKSFFGRGPKGYQRSDERIREDVCDRLTEDPMIDATHVDVTVKAGEVVLTGTVATRHEKRRAEDLIEDIFGVKDVANQLRVQTTTTTTAAEKPGNGSQAVSNIAGTTATKH